MMSIIYLISSCMSILRIKIYLTLLLVSNLKKEQQWRFGMPKKKKRIVVISDMHCGHKCGLTPSSWLYTPPETASISRRRLADFRSMAFDKYYSTIKSLKPIDILLVNGDCIDGRGEKSGGTELLTTDRDEQCDMAIELIEMTGSKNIVMTYGTGYHTGSLEDFENRIARDVKAKKIGGHEWVEANGVIFDVKHKVGASTVPHGRFTSIARENVWNILWSEREESPRSNVIIRSHVHYHGFCGGPDWLAMTTPALQGPGSKFGTRQCSGTVDFGLVHFDVNPSGSYVWEPHLVKMLRTKEMLLKL